MRFVLLRLVPVCFAAASVFGCAEATDPLADVRRDGGTNTDSAVPGDDTGTVVPGDDTGTTPGDGGGGCTVPTGKVCTMVPQCGCSASQNCDVTKTDGTTACVAAGSAPIMEPCDAIGQCQKGSSCIGGLCKKQCNTEADCPSGNICDQVMYTPTGSTTSQPVVGFKVCQVDSCDVLSPAAKCGSANCVLVEDGSSFCIPSGTGVGIGGCSEADPLTCAQGYICVNGNECLKWCRVGFSDCSLGETCGGFTTPHFVGGVEYGVCF